MPLCRGIEDKVVGVGKRSGGGTLSYKQGMRGFDTQKIQEKKTQHFFLQHILKIEFINCCIEVTYYYV